MKKLQFLKTISFVLLITFIPLLFGACVSIPINGVDYGPYIVGGTAAGGSVGIFLLVRHIKAKSAEKKQAKEIKELQELREKERQQKIAKENIILKNDPIEIELSELMNNYSSKISGNYIVKVKLDYFSNKFMDNEISFSPSTIEFDDGVKSLYTLRKPDECYDLYVTLKGVDYFSLWITNMEGDFFAEGEKLTYDEEQKKAEQDRIEAERIAEEKRIEQERYLKSEEYFNTLSESDKFLNSYIHVRAGIDDFSTAKIKDLFYSPIFNDRFTVERFQNISKGKYSIRIIFKDQFTDDITNFTLYFTRYIFNTVLMDRMRVQKPSEFIDQSLTAWNEISAGFIQLYISMALNE
jgi:hypothetical protein